MKKITMMELRRNPGKYIYWLVGHDGESFIITNNGKPVAQLLPLDDTIVLPNGKIIGPPPPTFRRPELLRKH